MQRQNFKELSKCRYMNIIVKTAVMILNTSSLDLKNRVALHAAVKRWLSRCQRAALSVRESVEKPYPLPPLHQGVAGVLQQAARAVVAINEQNHR